MNAGTLYNITDLVTCYNWLVKCFETKYVLKLIKKNKQSLPAYSWLLNIYIPSKIDVIIRKKLLKTSAISLQTF